MYSSNILLYYPNHLNNRIKLPHASKRRNVILQFTVHLPMSSGAWRGA